MENQVVRPATGDSHVSLRLFSACHPYGNIPGAPASGHEPSFARGCSALSPVIKGTESLSQHDAQRVLGRKSLTSFTNQPRPTYTCPTGKTMASNMLTFASKLAIASAALAISLRSIIGSWSCGLPLLSRRSVITLPG